MAYIRRRDRLKAGIRCLDNPSSTALILKIKHGHNQHVKKKVPTFSMRGKLLTRPRRKKR